MAKRLSVSSSGNGSLQGLGEDHGGASPRKALQEAGAVAQPPIAQLAMVEEAAVPIIPVGSR